MEKACQNFIDILIAATIGHISNKLTRFRSAPSFYCLQKRHFSCPAPAAAIFFPAGKACGGTITTAYQGSSAITPTVGAMTWYLGFLLHGFDAELSNQKPLVV